jgi:DnaK suppressor protein
MNSKAPRFDKVFIARKREQLTKLREQLLNSAQAREAEEGNINSESAGQAREYEDDAQRLTNLELDGTLVDRDVLRLARIERALRKIEDGTYGYSDESGTSISIERLEAMPEAIYTFSEQEARDPIDESRAAPRKRT